MSAETEARLEEALRQHVADETGGGYMSGFYIVASAASPDASNETHYLYANHDGAPHEWLGLLGMGERRAQRWQADNDQ